ncbi:hypothetical protein GCM10029992_04850 [Glycomyces albus]
MRWIGPRPRSRRLVATVDPNGERSWRPPVAAWKQNCSRRALPYRSGVRNTRFRVVHTPRSIALLPWKALKAVGRGVRAGFRALRSPAGRLTVQCAVTALVVAAGLGAGHYLVPSAGPAWSFGAEPEPEPEEPTLVLAPEDAPAAGLPAPAGSDSDLTDLPGGDEATDSPTEAAGGLLAWARSLDHLGIPERALLSYGRAEILSARQNPGCNLSWTTLAGIGQTESNHGTTGGNRITSDGTTLTEIIGPEYDEMGPMQFLEETWENWQADGNADGVNDPTTSTTPPRPPRTTSAPAAAT